MKINEITETVQGEAPCTGYPCLLVRFSGCDLKCPYCDTDHSKFYNMEEEKLLQIIQDCKLKSILITGGEPFIQPGLLSLLRKIPKDKRVVLETNGNAEIDINDLFAFGNITLVMDVKLFDNLRWFNPLNLTKLTTGDVIKFVFWDRDSLSLAVEFVHGHQSLLPWGVIWAFSPTAELLKKSTKVQTYIEEITILQKKYSNQQFLFQTQLHRILGVA